MNLLTNSITGPFIMFFTVGFIFCVIYGIILDRKKDGNDKPSDFSSIPIGGRMVRQEKPHATYDKIGKIINKSYDCTTSEAAQKCVDDLYAIQSDLELFGDPENLKSYLASEIAEAEENLRDLQVDEWKEKADPILWEFGRDFSFVTSEDTHNFKNIEDVMKASQRCMKSWHKYWSLLDQMEVPANAHDYIDEYFFNTHEPCMHSSEELKKRLDAATNQLKPEHRRKKKLYSDIVDYVNRQGSVMRCELLKHPFPNATAKETEYCYRELIKQYRLVETKMGSRYFVSLSDKEKKKHSPPSP